MPAIPGNPGQLALLGALNPDELAKMMAAAGLQVAGGTANAIGTLGPAGNALAALSEGGPAGPSGAPAAPAAAGGAPAGRDISQALAAVQALTPQQAPAAQSIPAAPLPRPAAAPQTPGLAQIMQLLLGGQQAPQPTLSQLIAGR